MQNQRESIKILGAGPAGLTAAIVLARGGCRVQVYERRSDVGTRFNGDFQGIENWSYATDALAEISSMGVQLDSCCSPFQCLTIYNPQFIPKEIQCTTPAFYLVKRGRGDDTLDATLKRQAIEAGVELRFETRLDPREAAIVATGPRDGHRVIASGMTFETGRPDGVHIILHDELAPKGYAYFITSGGQATIATVLFERFSDANQCLERTVGKFSQLVGLDATNKPRKWGGYGAFKVPDSAIQDGRLYVGEAAGFQDLLFGFGIRCAMVSGHLAATSILQDRDYDHLWKARLLPHLKASVSNRFLYSLLGNVAYNWLWRASGNSTNPVGFMRWLYGWTLTRKIVYPFARRYYAHR